MKHYSLTARLALLFALLSFAVLASVGISLYRGLETQLRLRDDAALVTRVDQIRTLLQDTDTMKLIHEKPHLFENMLGNREALLVLRFPGRTPMIEINPARIPIPDVAPVAADAELSLDAVQHSADADGIPFIAVAALARTTDSPQELQIIAGRTMSERTRLLAAYRDRILIVALGAALLFALGGYLLLRRGLRPLRTLAEQTDTISMTNLDARIDGADAPRELSRLIAAFNAMLDRLAGSFAKLSQVSADMAHDLRTPIGNLLGQTEVALGQRRSVEQYETLLASNLEELQRLSRMSDNMLFLARSENADTAIECTALQAALELQRVADYFEGLAEERDLKITLDGDATVWADAMLLRRALANLLANAIRYADSGSVIVLQARPDNAGITLTVENRGPAIAAHDLPRLFDRFYRADASRRGSADASGLGLSIVRTIMQLHQGRWQATSAAGTTRFSLFFPNKK
jgi:two-component system heavy metal sensor histidine kinase CusS